MDVEAFIALMRMSEGDDKVVANLARIALELAKGIQEAEARAAFAEAALEAERAKVAELAASREPLYEAPARSLRPQKRREPVHATT